MALIEIDGLPISIAWWIFPVRELLVITCHNQMVNIPIFSKKKHHKITIFLVDQPIQNAPRPHLARSPWLVTNSPTMLPTVSESGHLQRARIRSGSTSKLVVLQRLRCLYGDSPGGSLIFWFSDWFLFDFAGCFSECHGDIFHGIWLAKLV